MIKRRLFVVFALFLILCVQQTVRAQSVVPIRLNEYSASNVGTPVDNFGQQSDWVELYNGHTAQVSLNGYYLSNDRNNLYKWKFPATFIMGVGTYSVVWLSGKNTVSNGNYHANFTIDQCKNQWLILVSPQGVIRDSVFVQKTKGGHSWGRVDPFTMGINAWKLYTSHSFMFANPPVNNYKGYVPKPFMRTIPGANPNPVSSPLINSGGFYSDPATIMYFSLGSDTASYTSSYSCYDIWYTLNGDYPVVGGANSTQYLDRETTPVTIDITKMIRAIAVLKPVVPPTPGVPTVTLVCDQDLLPSFCETNTYFMDPAHQLFNPDFGVISIALDVNDATWFDSNGNPPNTMVHVEYFDKKKQVTEGYGIINRPSNEAWLTVQKGFDVTIDDRQGFGCNFEGNIFNVEGLGVSSRTVFPTLQMYGGDLESHSLPLAVGTNSSFGTGLRDVFLQSLAIKYDLDVNPLHVKPVVTFQNGKYMGVYTLKEVYDKYYENYYHKQSKDSVDLAFYHNTDGYVGYPDGSISRFSPISSFKTNVFDVITTKPMTGPFYKSVLNQFDKSSFMDYMIVNSYAMNSSVWSYNIAYAKGGQASVPEGNKWHYYLWNMSTTFNYTAVATNTLVRNNPYYLACDTYSNTYEVSPQQAGNGHGLMMRALMNGTTGSREFQIEYKTRYQDLMNTALKCDNILKHFDYVNNLYKKEMNYHEDPANLGAFATAIPFQWDTNMYYLRKIISQRCFFAANSLNKAGCYGMPGPYEITVDVEPAGSGSVKLNTIVLDSYIWKGSYYNGPMSFKAIPTNTTFVFDHWEFQSHVPLNGRALSMDSLAISLAVPENVVAVFTDKSTDIQSGVNVPTGFTPNGDGNNDIFKPLGSALYVTEYEITIWNRWGQEVFRSLAPEDGWNGDYKGQQAVTGVYAFIIKYKNIYGESKMHKGNVTLTR